MTSQKATALLLCMLATAAASVVAQELEKIRDDLDRILPKDLSYEIQSSPVKGLKQIVIGPQVLYVTEDGGHLIEGNIFDLKTHVNVTETLKKAARNSALIKLLDTETLTYKAPQADAQTITVFTDVDCGFCRQFHSEMADYNAKGISIRYLLYPREGKNSEAYQKSQNIWCSRNQREAMNAIMTGKQVSVGNCATPIDKHIALGKLMEIRGTPAIILPSGEYIAGYIDPKQLREKMDGK